MSYCKVIIIGRLTKDPELKSTPNGLSICRITVAINRRYKNGDSSANKEETSYIDIDAFGKAAESVAKYFEKGKEIVAEGTLRQARWTDKNTGEAKSKVSVLMERFSFGSPAASKKKPAAQPNRSEEPKQAPAEEERYDDIPF